MAKKPAPKKITSPRLVRRNVDTNWFLERIEATVGSQRRFGKMINLDHVLVHRLIFGKRKFSFEDVAAFARVLGVTTDEILLHAGIKSAVDIGEDASGPDVIPIKGWVDDTLRIHWEAPKVVKKAPIPETATGNGIQVVRFQTEGTKLDALNGALAYFKPQKTITVDCVGRQCVVRLVGDTEEMGSLLCIVRRSYQAGAYRLTALNGETIHENAMVESASPVLWMKFQ